VNQRGAGSILISVDYRIPFFIACAAAIVMVGVTQRLDPTKRRTSAGVALWTRPGWRHGRACNSSLEGDRPPDGAGWCATNWALSVCSAVAKERGAFHRRRGKTRMPRSTVEKESTCR
jgi:hypothetical protein